MIRGSAMEIRKIGDSDISVSAITLGTWAIGGWMWGGTDERKAIDSIKASLDEGITAIDTAPAYGFGLSEAIVGKAIKGMRDKVRILTKYGLRWDLDEGEFHFDTHDNEGRPASIYKNSRKDSVVWECEQSLRRLGTDMIDVYQCHWRDHTTPLDETMEAMDRLVRDGKIRAAGVSNFAAEEIAECRKYFPIIVAQQPYSMIKRKAQDSVVACCREFGVGMLAYSPLQRGLLTGKITPDYEFAEDDHRKNNSDFSPESIKKINSMLAEMEPIARKHNATFAQLVIQWTVRQPAITAALVGARNAEQARENAAALSFQLTEEDLGQIEKKLLGYGF